MSELRKRFEKETGKKVEITAHFDCEYLECDYDVPVDIWNSEYILWLENLINKN